MLTIYEHLQDWDNSSLDEEEWTIQMEEAVLMYNEEYNKTYKPKSAISNYKSWKREKNPMLNEPTD